MSNTATAIYDTLQKNYISAGFSMRVRHFDLHANDLIPPGEEGVQHGGIEMCVLRPSSRI